MKLSEKFLSKVAYAHVSSSPVDDSEKKIQLYDVNEANQIMLGFRNLSLSNTSHTNHILTGITGYVKKGGITAILGASGSGKSVLMKFLSGRMPDLKYTGSLMLNGRRFRPNSRTNDLTFIPQEDILIGDITIRETFEIAAGLRVNASHDQRSATCNDVINVLGLSHVADNVVGTILKRGLSGGEKRRTCIGQELVVKPLVACLDEPTSGLDGTAAFDVIKSIKTYARESDGQFSVILSIHQPDYRILQLFDNLLILGNGGSLFFGTLNDAIMHFSKLGYNVPLGENPTDYFLSITDSTFSQSTVDFNQEYEVGKLGQKVAFVLKQNEIIGESAIIYENQSSTMHGLETGFWRQFSILLKREGTLALRDPTLYYLQMVLHIVYGLLIGVTFYHYDPVIDDTVSYIPGSVIWLIMLNSYVHVFKVYYLVNANKRFEHEKANSSYNILSYYISEQIISALSDLLFIPGAIIGFLLVGLPKESLGFYLLVMYFTANTAEGMLSFISKFTKNAAYAVVGAQAILVIFTVFAGGVFIPFDNVPSHWSWLSAISVMTHGSKAIMLHAFQYIDYSCPEKYQSESMCSYQGVELNGSRVDADSLEVNGLKVIDVFNGATGSPYASFGYLVILAVVFRVLVLLLYYFPVDYIVRKAKNMYSFLCFGTLPAKLLKIEMEVMRLRSEVNMVTEHLELSNNDYEKHEFNSEQIESLRLLREQSDMHRMLSFRESNAGMYVDKYLTFKELTVSIPSKNGEKVLIDNVSGHVKAGRVLALMGPSGAGKTTLLNALSGRATYAQVRGDVTVNGKTLTPNDLDYVPQFDDLNDLFSMREILLYHAKLKLSGDKIHKRVTELIHIFGLTSKADLRVTKLSGGERKRVSIAIGLIGEANVLYVDEPTTGLDSVSAYTVIEYITKVTRETGVISIVTIHQPSGQVFSMLQDLMLLEKGRLAYFGPRDKAKDYFESLGASCPPYSNPANLYLDLISSPPQLQENVEMTWADLYKQSLYYVPPTDFVFNDPTDESSGPIKPTCLPAMKIMLENMLVFYWRNVTVYWLRLLEIVAIALYIGSIYYRLDHKESEVQKIAGAAFFNTWCVLFAVISAAPSFVAERRIAFQEVLNGAYNTYMYCLVQFLASIPFTIFTSIVYQLIFHFMVGFNDSMESYIYAVLVTFLLLLIMEGIMLMVVEVLKEAMLSTTFSMVLLGCLFLFPGYFVKTEDLNDVVQWLSYIMPTRYSFNGYLDSIFRGQTYETASENISGKDILQNYFNLNVDKWENLAALLGYVALFRLGHLALQLYTVKPYMRKTISS